MLGAELARQDRGVSFLPPGARDLDPVAFFTAKIWDSADYDVVWLNYHAALHVRWTPDQIARLSHPVVVTYHDTGVPNSDQCKQLHALGTPFIIHEPAEDLPGAIYLRQGIPAARYPQNLFLGSGAPRYDNPWETWLGCQQRPIVGTVGFPFPWKNYDLLCHGAALAGWSVLLIAPGEYAGHKPTGLLDHIDQWRQLNPWTAVVDGFPSTESVVAQLSACDATAFLYTCCNTGTSGAIRQGIAARKPVIATTSCRQFRDLYEDPVGQAAISWIDVVDPGQPEKVADALAALPIQRVSPPVVRLAEQDSWARQADRYAEIFQAAAGQKAGTHL